MTNRGLGREEPDPRHRAGDEIRGSDLRGGATFRPRDGQKDEPHLGGPEERGSREDSGFLAEPGLHDGQRFGPWLRSQRELREIELREISESSKISLRYLEAMENGDFHLLPAPVFTKGFLRQYASYVGLDPEEVVSFYLAARQALDDEAEDHSQLEVSAPPRSGPQAWHFVLFAAILAAVILGILWGLSHWRQDEPEDGVPISAGEMGAAAPGADPGSPMAAAPAGPPRDGFEGAGAEAGNSGRSAGQGTTSSPTAGAGASMVDDPAPGAPSVEPRAADSAPLSRGTLSRGPLSRGPLSRAPIWLALDFVGQCWVEASVDGERRLAQMRIQGESLLLEASSGIELRLGDVTAVRMELNGMPYDPGLGPGGRVVRQLTLDLETVGQLRAAAGARGGSPSPDGTAPPGRDGAGGAES
ncbi:MAG: DUF4115 domain-containing protein [Holophagales bacterium]|nr:DUF4115 domain-containing protein [Holophagales bacterium]